MTDKAKNKLDETIDYIKKLDSNIALCWDQWKADLHSELQNICKSQKELDQVVDLLKKQNIGWLEYDGWNTLTGKDDLKNVCDELNHMFHLTFHQWDQWKANIYAKLQNICKSQKELDLVVDLLKKQNIGGITHEILDKLAEYLFADKINIIYDKLIFADTKTKKVMIVCERQFKYTRSKTVAELQENDIVADSISNYKVTEWYHLQPQSEMIADDDDEQAIMGIEEWIVAVSKKFNVVELYDENAELEAELDNGEFITVNRNLHLL